MKKYLLVKFENMVSDLKSFLMKSDQLTKRTNAPKMARKSYSQAILIKKKSITKTAKNKRKAVLDTQKTASFSGSGYNGQGSADHSKIRSNKKRR
jgi:hypothetical protein